MMRCPGCGSELALDQSFCARCGAPAPPPSDSFARARRRFDALRTRYQSGELDAAQFQVEREALTVQDTEGGHWTPAEAGQWYWYDGSAWVLRTPPMVSGKGRPSAGGGRWTDPTADVARHRGGCGYCDLPGVGRLRALEAGSTVTGGPQLGDAGRSASPDRLADAHTSAPSYAAAANRHGTPFPYGVDGATAHRAAGPSLRTGSTPWRCSALRG